MVFLGAAYPNRTPLNIEQPPIPIEIADKMRKAITDALRAYADGVGLAHDIDRVETACIPEMKWWKVTFEHGIIGLQIECEALLTARPKADGEDSHICYLERVHFSDEDEA